MISGDWLESLRQTLASTERAVIVFFRDDGAGWSDAALMRLLDLLRSLDSVTCRRMRNLAW